MFRQYLAQRIGFPLQDLWTGTEIINSLRLLRGSQYWDETGMHEYRLSKLKALVDHAYHNVPYYRKEFDRIKLKPADIRGFDDLFKIPVVYGKVFRGRNMEFVARGSHQRNIRIGKTGGTTGTPAIVYKDTADRTMTWASYYRWFEWMGVSMGEKTATFWGAGSVTENNFPETVRQQIINFLQNAYVFNSFNINKEVLPHVIERLNRTEPVLLKGYLSSLLFLAGYMNDTGVRLFFPLKAVSSTTETLSLRDREVLTATFRAPVFDQYGCGEASGIAYECNQHSGMHITQEHVIVEILDDNENPTAETGNVIITNLDNLIMPFIRYANGDMAAMAKDICSCGVTAPRLISVEGRASDTITLKSGAKVHGVFFTDILYEKGILTDKIRRFQVLQKRPGEIEFRIESPVRIDNLTDSVLQEVLNKYFTKVEINRFEMLENEPNGKFRYIKSEIS
ncbi:MAG: hypothetical protein WAW07_15800 [Bacteroidales bacterium]